MPYCTTCQFDLPSGTRVCPRCHALQPAFVAPPKTRAPLDLGYARITFDTKLGEGATAIVWRGEMVPTHDDGRTQPTVVAVKELRPERRGGPHGEAARAMLRNEADILLSIDHPSVVHLVDVVAGGTDEMALVFEYVEGETLESLLARQLAKAKAAGQERNRISYSFSWSVFQQLLAGLAATHNAGRVHADVKPANLLLRTDTAVKLTDFGLARPLGTAMPAEESGAGTAAYIPPEQVLGHALDARSDLYSAGLLLFEMLAGRTAFDTEGRAELAVRMDQLHRMPPPLRTFAPDAPPALDGLFQRALAKDPRARFSSAREMADAFGAIMHLAGRVSTKPR